MQRYIFYHQFCHFYHWIHFFIDQFDSFLLKINRFLTIFLMNVFFDNVHSQNQAWQSHRLKMLKTAVLVAGKNYRFLTDCSRSTNLSQKVRKVRIQLISESCNLNLIYKLIVQISVDDSARDINYINYIYQICSSLINKQTEIYCSLCHIWQKTEAIQHSTAENSKTDWIHSLNNFICLSQKLLQFRI